MSEFNIEDLDAVIAQGREGSLAQMLALQLKGQIKKAELLVADNEKAMDSIRQADAAVKLANEKYSAIAAENVQVRERHRFIRALAISILEHSGGRHDWRGAMEDASDLVKTVDEVYSSTPATDRIVAGIKADGRVEGINFAAGRLAAAFNHGFVDKPMAEVFDVVRMILTAKEDLANDPALPADGLSGEYAEKSLAEWESVLCEGADK